MVSEFTVQVEHITVLGFRAEEQFTSLCQDCRYDDSQTVAVCNKEKCCWYFLHNVLMGNNQDRRRTSRLNTIIDAKFGVRSNLTVEEGKSDQ